MDFPLTEEEKQKLGGIIIKEPKRGGCLSVFIVVVLSYLLT